MADFPPVDQHWMGADNAEDDFWRKTAAVVLAERAGIVVAEKVVEPGLVLQQPFGAGGAA